MTHVPHLAGMRHEDDGRSTSVQPLQHAEHVLGARGVEVSGRLVCEHDARLGDERPRDSGALLLPSRKLCRQMGRAVREAYIRERIKDALTAVSQRHAPVNERELDVLVGRRAWQEVVRLEHKPDLSAANVRPPLLGKL